METLTIKEVADLKGCSERYIRQLINQGKLKAEESVSKINNRKMYIIKVQDLPEELQSVYYARQTNETSQSVKKVYKKIFKKKNREYKDYEEFTEDERHEIDLWVGVLNEWQEHRQSYDVKGEADEVFVVMKNDYFKKNDINEKVSRSKLYSMYKDYKDGYLQGLLDNRNKYLKGTTSLTEEMKKVFNTFFLTQNKLSVSRCYQISRWYFEFEKPEVLENFPSERAFRRYSKTLNEYILLYMREGNKAVYDKIIPYFIREYENLEANDCWIADGHTFDVITEKDGKKHRLTLTAFMDAKTGVMVGWHISDNPCSQATVLALRHGILRFGRPKTIYCDNGREYLTYDLGGMGHRLRKGKEHLDVPPNILQRLGITIVNAIVANARAKNIERAFDTLKNHISRNISTFTGGTPAERPEQHARIIKSGNILNDEEFKEKVNTLIDGIYNVALYGGCESKFDGYTRIDAWNESIKNTNFVTVPEDNLNLLLMRSSRLQKVNRSMVHIKIFGEKWTYTSEDLYKYHGKEVYLRVDPDKPKTARLYNSEDQFMFEVQSADMFKIDFLSDDKEKIAMGMKDIRKVQKSVKKDSKELISNDLKLDALDLSIRKGLSNINGGKFEIIQPKGTAYTLTDKEKPLSEVAGFENISYVTVDGEIIEKTEV